MDVLHPAKFSKTVLKELQAIVDDERARVPIREWLNILDPFAGTGRIHELADWKRNIETFGIEIEPEWAHLHPNTQVGDATALPFEVRSVQMVVTSCTYGNRLADHHQPKDASIRRSYTFDLRNMTGDPTRELARNNTGLYLFTNPRYKALHEAAWREVWRVLVPGGLFVLNISDFIRNKKVVNVVRWHIDKLMDMGFSVEKEIEVPTPRLRFGAHMEARVAHEKIFCMRRP